MDRDEGPPRPASMKAEQASILVSGERMALTGGGRTPRATPIYQPEVLKPSINVDNLRWKMIGVCLHQPPPRPKPARLAHLACHAARTTWARRALAPHFRLLEL